MDPEGKDIIVLNATDGAGGFGHAAVLIGNEKSGWRFYSKNGTYSSSGSSGHSDNQENNIYFKNLKNFANSSPNFDEEGDVKYKSAFRIKSDKSQDNKAKSAASKAVNSDCVVIG